MRYLFGLMCALALGLMGCSETTGGGAECQTPQDCDDGNECIENSCVNGMCESLPVADGTPCGGDAGTCQQASCRVACDEQGILDAIVAGGGPYTFDCEGPTTLVTQATIEIDNDVILDGAGELTLDGNDDHQVLSVVEGVTAELRALIVTNGADDGWAAGIDNFGSLTLVDSTVSDNTGSGIVSQGTLTLMNSIVSENAGGGVGGGIHALGLMTLVVNSTISGNSSPFGGGINACAPMTGLICRPLTIINSTVSGNTGGGIAGGDPLILVNSTVSGNTADDGAAIFVSHDSFAINSTISGNLGGTDITGGGPLALTNSLVDGDCGDTMTSNGYNIESPGNTCGFDQTTDQVNVSDIELNLGELADNGGPTETHTLGAGSVAIDVIPVEECVDADGEPLTTDQRGEPRPGGTMCDVGAFEVQP